MVHRDILGIVVSAEDGEPTIAAMEMIARDGDSATALLVQLLPNPSYLAEAVGMPGLWADFLVRAREEFANDFAALKARCARAARPLSATPLESLIGFAGVDAAGIARQHDLSIITRPPEHTGDRITLFEELLLGSGRPVLLLPPNWRGPIGRRILVGWNGRREAARALADASPFLESAESITVVTVSTETSGDPQVRPQEIVDHLARKGMVASARTVSTDRDADGGRLHAEAVAERADLIVVGGYGKARLREFVFGGVTNTLIHGSIVPVLLSH